MLKLRKRVRALGVKGIISALSGFLVLAVIIGGLIWVGAQSDRRGDSTEFRASEAPGEAASRAAQVRGSGGGDSAVSWPNWGYDQQHSRYLPTVQSRPPFGVKWQVRARALLEFPPVIGYGRLFFGDEDGTVRALDQRDGSEAWRTQTSSPIAASPALHESKLYVPVKDGSLWVLDAGTGKVEWKFRADGPIESSPMIFGRRVLFGSHDDHLYAVDTRTHRQVWKYRASGDIKGSPAIEGRTAYIGTYDGQVHAVRLKDGSEVWTTQTRREFSFGGALYSSPTVAYGRVYVGSTDGRVYSLGARSGEIIWVRSTDDWVYGSPALARKRVYVGSFDRNFYALDARTGDVKWDFAADGRIAGSATVLGDVVYFSTLGEPGDNTGTTYALRASDGKRLWTFPDGRYSPITASGDQLFLTGRTRIYALEPAEEKNTGTADLAPATETVPSG